MTSSPKIVSPSLNIFRPWQIKVDSNTGESNPKIMDIKSFHEEYLPSGSMMPSSLGKVNSFLPIQSPESHKDKESLSESLVTSSTSLPEDDFKVFAKNFGMKKRKRSIESSEHEVKTKKTKHVPNKSLLPSQQSSLLHPTSISPSSLSSLQDTFKSSSLPFQPHFLQTSSPYGPLVPILEPPIFVPAAEIERVCTRRPRPKRFSCSECGAAFSNRGQLSGHCRIHTGERPFRCNQPGCGKKFTRNEELTRHRRIHSGLRPFACTVCPKRFGRKDHLKKHLRTHTRHMLPQFPPLPHFEQLQHLHHVQHLQQIHHLHQIQQLQMQMPLIPFTQHTKAI